MRWVHRTEGPDVVSTSPARRSGVLHEWVVCLLGPQDVVAQGCPPDVAVCVQRAQAFGATVS